MAGAKKKQEKKKQRENAKKKINNDKDQDSETDENENSLFPMRERSEKAKIMQAKVGGKFAARDKFALSVASMRGEHYKRKRKEILNLKKYRLQKDADAIALKKLQEDRWYEFWKARSVEVVEGSVATPPMSANFYHMIEIMEKDVSVLQLLFELHDGYYVGFRPTPPDPYAKGGFYIFSNVKLPDFFGDCFKIDRSSDYQATGQVMIGLNFLGTMTDELSTVNQKSINGVYGGIMETPMIVFGEGLRMREFEDFIGENYEGDLVQLPGRLSIFYGNWSCLSKLSFHIRLAIWEMVLRCHTRRAAIRSAWQLLRQVVQKFERLGHRLELFDEDGNFCFGRLVGPQGILRVLKFEESVVKKLIIRSQYIKSSFVDVKHKPNEEDSELDSDSEDEKADDDDEEADDDDEEADDDEDEGLKNEYRRMADREYRRWKLILADGDMDLLVELLRQ